MLTSNGYFFKETSNSNSTTVFLLTRVSFWMIQIRGGETVSLQLMIDRQSAAFLTLYISFETYLQRLYFEWTTFDTDFEADILYIFKEGKCTNKASHDLPNPPPVI